METFCAHNLQIAELHGYELWVQISTKVVRELISQIPSCCSVGVCFMYSWSPNCCKLFSKILSISFLELEKTAIAARRTPTASPVPAPDKLVNQLKRCARRASSFKTMLFR